MVVPSPGSPIRPVVMFSGTAQRWINSCSGEKVNCHYDFFFVTWVNQNMKGLFRALSLKNYLQRIFAPRWNWADHQHDSSFVPAKVSRELHLQRETDVIQGELGGQGDRVIRVLKVNESRLLGRKRNLLTGGCCARVEGWRRPCSIPAAMENFKVTL